jgi:hypothetical protein
VKTDINTESKSADVFRAPLDANIAFLVIKLPKPLGPHRSATYSK